MDVVLTSPPVHSAVEQVDEAVDAADELALLAALQLPCLSLRGLRSEHGLWYLEQLAADRQQKALVSMPTCFYPLKDPAEMSSQ